MLCPDIFLTDTLLCPDNILWTTQLFVTKCVFPSWELSEHGNCIVGLSATLLCPVNIFWTARPFVTVCVFPGWELSEHDLYHGSVGCIALYRQYRLNHLTFGNQIIMCFQVVGHPALSTQYLQNCWTFCNQMCVSRLRALRAWFVLWVCRPRCPTTWTLPASCVSTLTAASSSSTDASGRCPWVRPSLVRLHAFF